ncbi:MAG: Kelch repeat protein, partial [Acidimicrobiaceae bacterium]
APGTSGQFLKTLGASANPAWGDPAGSGDVTDVGNCTGGGCFKDGVTTGGTQLVIEGTTDNLVESILAFPADPTVDATLTLPDAALAANDVLVGSGAGTLTYLNLATTQILIGDGSGAPTAAALSGDATMTNAGVVTVVDDLHAHTSTTISGLDISADTNLAGTANEIVLTDDTLSLAAAITRDAEWNSASAINTATTDDDFVTLTGIQTLTGAKTFAKVNAANAGADAVTLSGTVGLLDATGPDVFRGLYLNYTNSANHTGGSFTGLDIGGIAADAEATEVALQIGSGWDTAISAGGSVLLDSIAATNAAGVNAPVLTLRGSYDSDSGVGTIATDRDVTLTHTVGYNAAAGSSQLDLDIGGGGVDFTIDGAGDITTASVKTASIEANAVDGTKLAMGSDAQGDVLYYNGTDYVRLAPGTSGQFLKTLGASANPA